MTDESAPGTGAADREEGSTESPGWGPVLSDACIELDWPHEWLICLLKGNTVHDCCRLVGVHRTTVYKLRDRDPTFREAWQEVKRRKIERLEQSTWERATDGWLEPVFQRGEEVGRIRKYDNRLSTWLLERAMRKQYHLKEEVAADSLEQLAGELVAAANKIRGTVPEASTEDDAGSVAD